MAYAPPAITGAGLSVPVYPDILQDFVSAYQSAYGLPSYVQPDAADYQWISAVSKKANDAMGAVILCYNSRSPQTAVGADLDSIALIVNITRLPATFSEAALTITGVVGTVITNGVAVDQNGVLWALPTPLTIPTGGTTVVTAMCLTPGAVLAAPGIINQQSTPQGGWTGVTNVAAAIPGNPVETDSAFRGRIALSTGLNSLTTLDATIAAIAAVDGVTRYNVLENYTASSETIDGVTVNAHSIAAIVEGGDADDVAYAIYANRGIGCGMNNGITGFFATLVTDPITGYQMNVYFSLPTYVPIYTALSITAFAGYTAVTRTAVIAAVTNYLNSLQIGENVTLSGLYAAAMSVMPNISEPLFSITAFKLGTAPAPTGTADININGNAVAQGVSANCVVTP